VDTGIDLSSLVASQPSQGYLNLQVYEMVRLNPYPYPKIRVVSLNKPQNVESIFFENMKLTC
jgi:hypothetical protein